MSTQNVNVASLCSQMLNETFPVIFKHSLCSFGLKIDKNETFLRQISNIVIRAGNKFSFSFYYIFPAQFQSGNLTRWSVTHRNCKSILSQTSSSSSLECQEMDTFLQDGNSKLHLVAKRENTCPSIWFMTNARAKHY